MSEFRKIPGRTGTSRRAFMLSAAAGAVAASLIDQSRGSAAEKTEFPVVGTTYGKLRGRTRPDNGISIFKGVPYGAPTGGANRFLPPRRPASWKGVRDALHLGSPCPQVNPDTYEWWIDPEVPSEDCLYLNVWTPTLERAPTSLPVMVWLHGGGFWWGSGGAPAYDGQNLAKTGNVVVVTVNHRLNVFGYGYVGSGADERFASSGNVGQLDIVAALEWVRDNVGHFGGDPGNVTIFGESGGGGKVSALIAMPAAVGLFHKAIVQSGSMLEVAEPEDAAAVAAAVYRYFDIKPGNAVALQHVPTEKLALAYGELVEGMHGITAPKSGKSLSAANPMMRFSPVVDGRVIPRQTWSPRAPEYASRIPMIIGTTAEEAALSCSSASTGLDVTDDSAVSAALAKCQFLSAGDLHEDLSPRLAQIYRKTMPNVSPTEFLVRMATDTGAWRSALMQVSRKLEAGGPPVFMCEFNWKVPFVGGSWAQHGVDLAFVFGYTDYPKAWDEGDSAAKRAAADPQNLRYGLATQTMEAWAAFARTGNPSTSTLKWPAYDAETRATMIFGGQSEIVNDPRSSLRKALLAG